MRPWNGFRPYSMTLHFVFMFFFFSQTITIVAQHPFVSIPWPSA